MIITEFIKQINKLNNSGASSIKEKMISERIKRTYIPIMDKINKSNEILEKSIVNEDGVEYVDAVINEINFIVTIFLSYTDLTEPLDEDNEPSLIAMYDAVKSSGIDEEILPRIGKDLLEYRYINERAIETWERKGRKNEG